MDALLGENRAVHLDRGKAFECLSNGLVRDFPGLFEGLALYELGCHAARCDRSTATESLELRIGDYVVLDFQVNIHDIPADRVPDLSDTAWVFYLAHVPRVLEMVHDLVTVHYEAPSLPIFL